MKYLFLFLSFITLLSLSALPKIAVDCVHGFDYVDELQEIYPDYEFIRINGDFFPIDNVIQEGSFPLNDSLYTSLFTVTENMDNLYIVTNDNTLENDYYIYLISPEGEYYELYQGILEIENPMPGEWLIIDGDEFLGHMPLDFLIGTGPAFLENLDILEYAAMIRIWNNTYAFFLGMVNEYTQNEKNIIENWVNSGFNYAGIYDSQCDAALKPVIRIYNATKPVDVNISFDGAPAYNYPPAEIERNNLTSYSWKNVFSKGKYSELLYETAMKKSPSFIKHNVIDHRRVSIFNQSPYPTFGNAIVRFIGNSTYLYGQKSSLESGEHKSINLTKMKGNDLKKMLHNHLRDVMIKRGLPKDIAEEFIQKYNWTERIMADLAKYDDYLSLYLIDNEAYNSIFPMELSENPSELLRILWMWEVNISKQKNEPFFAQTFSEPTLERDNFQYFEYGFYRIDRDREPLSMFDLTIHNDDMILDPDNNDGDSSVPIFHIFGQNDISMILTQNVTQVHNYYAPYIDYSAIWSPIILGDDNSYAMEGNPDVICCLVAKDTGSGKALIGGTGFLINVNNWGGDPMNTPLPQNIFNWLTEGTITTVHVPQDYETINEAIANVTSGSTIIVSDGMYHESINYLGKNLTIRSENGVLHSTIYPANHQSAVIIENGEDETTVFDGFTIYGATVPAIRIFNSSPQIINNRILGGNMDDWYYNGAGIACKNSSSRIDHNIITENTGAYYGGGIYLENWDGVLISNGVIGNTTFSGDGCDDGSGVYIMGSSGEIMGNNISYNGTDYEASALCLQNSNTIVTDNSIISNDQRGIALAEESNPVINHNDIFGNAGYDVYCRFTPSDQTIDFTQNYWGEETTSEMDNTNYPANIEAIYDQMDDEQLALIDYQDWLPNSINSSSEEINISARSLDLTNYPNPFNPSTTISFNLTQKSDFAGLDVFNIKGQKVRNLYSGTAGLGKHTVIWDGKDKNGKNVTSGVYLYKLNVNNKTYAIEKCLLIK